MEKANTYGDEHLEVIEDIVKLKSNRVPGVRTVLVVLSSRGMPFDTDSLRQKVLVAYPDSNVFFKTTMGKDFGQKCPSKVDLLIDLTGPRMRQGWFYSKKLRRMARVAIGRNAGLFRKRIYDRVFDEKAIKDELPKSATLRERVVQREVLALAGISVGIEGAPLPDLGKSIAVDLPPMARAE